MKIFVCVKHVPDTAAIITVEGEAGYDDTDTKFIANPYDEFAVEEAVSLVEQHGGEVVIVTVSNGGAVSTIRGALAMGADRAILVKTDDQFLESTMTARALKAAIEKDGPGDLVFTGKGSIDTETFQTHYRLAQLLNVPVVNDVSSLSLDGDRVTVQRLSGGGEKQILEMRLPCILGTEKGLNVPRYPSFPNVMKAKKKEIKEIAMTDLDLGQPGGRVIMDSLEAVPERSAATMIEGTVDEQVTELVRILKENERVL